MISLKNNQEAIRSLIITHNYPLRMLIMKLLCNSNLNRCYDFEKNRWQNCCVLKLELFPNHTFLLTLLHPGEIDKTEKKAYHYWSNESSQLSLGSSYGTRTYHAMTEALTGHIDINTDNKNNQHNIFYLMRHGQAKHYTMNCIIKTIKATHSKHLTIEGKQMTYRAGQSIYTDLQKTNSKLDYCYVSDLIRTQETFMHILKIMTIDYFNLDNTSSAHILDVFVLPRYHRYKHTMNKKIDDCEYARTTIDSHENQIKHIIQMNINWIYQKHTLNLPILEEIIRGKIYSKKRYSHRKMKYNRMSRRHSKSHFTSFKRSML